MTLAAARSTFGAGSRQRRGGSEVHHGDTHLGGDDVDQKIVDWLIDEFKKEHGIDLGKERWRCSG